MNNARLFDPFHVVEIGGMKVLFIGVVTEAVISRCKDDGIAGSLVVAEDALKEIGHICDTYNGLDIDLTVLLTHIGFEEDKKLAAQLDPTWGVDLIIGGHSHTLRDETFAGGHAEFFQVSSGLELEYDQASHSFTRFDFDGEPVEDDRVFTVGIQQYCLTNTEYMFDMSIDELRANRHERTLASSCAGILEEVLNTGEYRDVEGMGRMTLNLC